MARRLRSIFLTSSAYIALVSVGCALCDSEGPKDCCMSQYEDDPSKFEVCKYHPCLLFKGAKPSVEVEKNFSRFPFRCKDRDEKLGVQGPFFDFVDRMKSLNDAYCIFNGPECTYDEQINFLSHAHKKNGSHQFIVAGLMFLMSNQISNISIPSTAFTHGPIITVGPLDSHHLSFNEALDAVFGPFQRNAWLFIGFLIIFFVLVRVGISLSFTNPFNWRSMWWNIWGEYEASKRCSPPDLEANRVSNDSSEDLWGTVSQDEEEKHQELLMFYNKYWSVSVKLFIFLTVIFYELALFTHVVTNLAPTINTFDLSDDEMNKFVIIRNSAYEAYFRASADPHRRYSINDPKIPWKRVDSMPEVYESVMKNEMFSISYERALIYQMEQSHACNNMTFYSTVKRRSYHGVWFYSSDVQQETRIAIDKNLTELAVRGVVDQVLHGGHERAEYSSCGRSKPRIDFMLLVLPLVPISLLLMLFIFLRVSYSLIRKVTTIVYKGVSRLQ